MGKFHKLDYVDYSSEMRGLHSSWAHPWGAWHPEKQEPRGRDQEWGLKWGTVESLYRWLLSKVIQLELFFNFTWWYESNIFSRNSAPDFELCSFPGLELRVPVLSQYRAVAGRCITLMIMRGYSQPLQHAVLLGHWCSAGGGNKSTLQLRHLKLAMGLSQSNPTIN